MLNQNIKVTNRGSLRSNNSNTPASKINSSLEPQNMNNFDQIRFYDHYQKIKEHQHQKLATINMSEDLKKKLFGFSEGYYVTNEVDPKNLVVEDHPLRGRIIMSRQKYEKYLIQKQKEKDLKPAYTQKGTTNRVQTVEARFSSGEIQGRIKEVKELPNKSMEFSESEIIIKRSS